MIQILLGFYLVVAILSVYFNIREDGSPTKELFETVKETETKKDSIVPTIVSVILLLTIMLPFLLLTLLLDIIVFLAVLCAEAEMFLATGASEIKK